MATLSELGQALINADKAGDTDAARKLAAVITQARQDPVNLIPGTQVEGTQPAEPEPTVGEQAVGAGEAILTAGTAATGGTAGMVGGTLKAIAEEILSGEFGTPEAATRIEEEAMRGAEALTYAPRTTVGKEIVKEGGELLAPLQALGPMIPEFVAVGATARATTPAARAVTQKVTAPVTELTRRVIDRVREPEKPTAGTGAAAGAQAVDKATLRQAQAEELPVPIKLTEGQATREFEQQRFERETAKLPEIGEPIRERFAQQNLQLQQNMDAFIDMTGAEASDLRGVGLIVDKALRERAAKDKRKIRVLYKDAEKAGEMESTVNLSRLVDLLNESQAAESTAPILVAAKKELIRLGGATEDEAGNLTIREITKGISLNNVEQLRKFVNKVTGNDPTNIKFAVDLKKAIDESTEGMGGDKYRQARRARMKYAQDYENVGVVKQLLNAKRGTDDRAIALEDVLRRVVLTPSTSLDTMRQVRRLLQTKGGEQGKQAWRELQGGTLRHIRDETLKSVSTDQDGNTVFSPSQLDRVITQLDKSGKLDYIFGKKSAEQLRVINDVAKDVMTSPPGVVNASNTASVLAGLVDIAISGTAGVPAPIMSSFRILTNSIKDAKLKARVKKALGE